MEEQGGLFKDCTQSQSPSHSNFYKEYPRSVQDCEHLQRNIHQDLQQNKVHWKSFEQEQLNWNKCLNIVFSDFLAFHCMEASLSNFKHSLANPLNMTLQTHPSLWEKSVRSRLKNLFQLIKGFREAYSWRCWRGLGTSGRKGDGKNSIWTRRQIF